MKVLHTFDNSHYYPALSGRANGGIQIYRVDRQRGGSISGVVRIFSKYVVPLFNRYILPHAQKSLVTTATDMLEGASLKSALKKNSKVLAKNILSGIQNPSQSGSGRKRVKVRYFNSTFYLFYLINGLLTGA